MSSHPAVSSRRRIRWTAYVRPVAIGVLIAYVVGATPYVPGIVQALAETVGDAIGSLTAPQDDDHGAGGVDSASSPTTPPSAINQPSPGPTVTSTAQPLAASPSDCRADPTIRWTNHEPNFKPMISMSAGLCEILMVSSQRLDIPGGGRCQADTRHICVLVMPSRTGASMTVTGLGVSWWGTARTTVEAAIADKVTDSKIGWFSAANCSGGCDGAYVYVLDEAGRASGARLIERP